MCWATLSSWKSTTIKNKKYIMDISEMALGMVTFLNGKNRFKMQTVTLICSNTKLSYYHLYFQNSLCSLCLCLSWYHSKHSAVRQVFSLVRPSCIFYQLTTLLCFTRWWFEKMLVKTFLRDSYASVSSFLWYIILTETELIVSVVISSQYNSNID